MLVYIVIGLVTIAVLWAAYRAFGGGAAKQVDSTALLREAARSLNIAAGELSDALETKDSAAQPAATVRSARRTVEGCTELLERVDPAALDSAGHAAHTLLGAVVEDLSWAARISETAGWRANSGLRQATDLLRSQADRALREAGDALRSAVPEEVDSPA